MSFQRFSDFGMGFTLGSFTVVVVGVFLEFCR